METQKIRLHFYLKEIGIKKLSRIKVAFQCEQNADLENVRDLLKRDVRDEGFKLTPEELNVFDVWADTLNLKDYFVE